MPYENLPGINVQLKDGGLVIPEKGGSETVLVIAPSLILDAPDEPVMIRSSSDLIEYRFGDFYVNGVINPIAQEWKAAVDAGAKSVYLVALKEISSAKALELENAAIAAYQAKGHTLAEAQAKFQSVLTGATEDCKKRRKFIYFYDLLMGTLLDFNVDHVVLKGMTLEDEVTDLDGAFFPEVPNAEDFPNIGGMVITSYVLKSSQVAYPLTITTNTNDKIILTVDGTDLTFTLPPKVYNGTTLTVKDLANDIQAVFDAHASKIVTRVEEGNQVLTFHFEDPVTVKAGTTLTALGLTGSATLVKSANGLIVKGTFAKTIGDYCEVKTLMKKATLGYIGVGSPLDTKISTIGAHTNTLAALDSEVSPYLQIVASETGVVMPGTNVVEYINGATHYAALVANLAPQSAPTNKVVRGAKALRFQYSLRQLSRLTGKKIVTFRINENNQLVVTDGITSAPTIVVAGRTRESDFSRLSTLRITQLTIEVVRNAVEPFIGEINDMPRYNALNTVVKSALEKLREAGIIQGYEFSVVNRSSRLDEASILLSIVPAFELRRIDVEVSLAPSQAMLAALL